MSKERIKCLRTFLAMIAHMKIYLMLLFVLSCSFHVIAQSDFYYYYKGAKQPLTVNENKVVVSIPKEREEVCERVLSNAQTLDTIRDGELDIYVISRSDFESLISMDSWKEDSKSVIITSCYYTEKGAEVYESPHLDVRLKKEEDIDLLTSYAERYKLRIIRNMPSMPLWYILSVTSDSEESPLECANKIFESGQFAASVPDLCSDVVACSNDSLFNLQWGLENPYSSLSDIDISASPAWEYATGKYVKIAIFDNGVDTTHVELAPNIRNLSYDAETGTSPSHIYGDHGTHCAGIAAAVKDNGIQIAGVAPEATIVPISFNLNSTSDNPLRIADGITWAYQHGVDIISCSWHRNTTNGAIDEAIDNAFKYGRQGKGCIVVFASGNHDDDANWNTNVLYPANCNDTILAVGAIDSIGARASLSNFGAELDLVAPGFNIISTLPNNSYGYDSGTSMACPHVAGVAALILELNPELTVTEVNSIICGTAKKLSGVNFNVTKPDGTWNNEYGYGLVDAYNSVWITPKIKYIQNDTITGEICIPAEKIYVGRDVTDRKEYGNVVIGPGNDIWLNAKRVVIKNSTKIPVGTNFYIGYVEE